MKLVKIKSVSYIAKHSLKSELSFMKLVDIWLTSNKCESEQIVKQLEALWDEEVVLWCLPYVIRLQDAIEEWEKIETQVHGLVAEHSHLSRKDFAIKMQAEQKDIFYLLMHVWQGKELEDKQIRNFMMQFDQGIKGQFN